MKELPPRYTLRVSQMLLDKLGYIADFEGRTKNKELEQMIKKRVHAFEAQYGEIPVKITARFRVYKKRGHGSLCGMPWPFLHAEGARCKTCGMPRRRAPAAPALVSREEMEKICAPSRWKRRPVPCVQVL